MRSWLILYVIICILTLAVRVPSWLNRPMGAYTDNEDAASHVLATVVAYDRVPASEPAGISRDEFLLQLLARSRVIAAQTDHAIDAAVQIDDGLVTRCLVQAVDVLGDEQAQRGAPLELAQGVMRRVRGGAAHLRPAERAARPVAAARGFVLHEVAKLDRCFALPGASFVAIVGNAGGGADAGAREHEHVAASDERAQFVELALATGEDGFWRCAQMLRPVMVVAPVLPGVPLPSAAAPLPLPMHTPSLA